LPHYAPARRDTNEKSPAITRRTDKENTQRRGKLEIRQSIKSDLAEILHVERQAFGDDEGPEIVELVKELLNDTSAMPLLSLLAIKDGNAVGHILFTRAHLSTSSGPVSVVNLAPLAVLPEAQSQGIGGRLIQEGLRQLSESGVELVFVLGDYTYYPRSGFQPASPLGFEAPYPIAEEIADAWMVQELRPGVIGRVTGKVICADALNKPELWRE
jgi:putative acetyltransferase